MDTDQKSDKVVQLAAVRERLQFLEDSKQLGGKDHRLLAVTLIAELQGLDTLKANDIYDACMEKGLDLIGVIDGQLSIDTVLEGW